MRTANFFRRFFALYNILIVDDNAHIRKLYEYTLEKNGFTPYLACDAKEALLLLDRVHIDLILLDVMMPGMDGYEFCSCLRENKMDLPVLMITAKCTADDKRRGFVCGVDDYMVKPVDEIEMVLRIKALLRRAKISEEQRIEIGTTVLDYGSMSVICADEVFSLPKKEFLLLFKLLSFPSRTFTRNQLMEEFWGFDSESEPRTVDVHINRLRDKFKDNPDFEIKTVRGLGYKAEKK